MSFTVSIIRGREREVEKERQLKLTVMTGLSRLDMIKHLISCSLLVGAILFIHEE